MSRQHETLDDGERAIALALERIADALEVTVPVLQEIKELLTPDKCTCGHLRVAHEEDGACRAGGGPSSPSRECWVCGCEKFDPKKSA